MGKTLCRQWKSFAVLPENHALVKTVCAAQYIRVALSVPIKGEYVSRTVHEV